ncbi:helix-turn-helix transcriptional regulator [Kordiimonas sp.]|uniref:helix-turn-helix transcriptional regulator n=1 Tax=Kordiimonas sp. TaxID=1970157 RepID=UPI003B52D273
MKSFLRVHEVSARTGYAISTIYLKVSKGEFPAPVKLGARASAWDSDEVSAWMDERIAERNQAA